MKRFTKISIIICTCMLFVSCGSETTAEKKFLRPVKFQQIGFAGNEKASTFSGTAETDKIIDLSFRNSGVIAEFDIRIGQKVKKGQQLARLDNVQSRLSYEQAITQKNSAESQLNTAKLSLDRVRSLYEKGSTSLSDLESAKNAHKTAQESYESAKRGVAIQQEQVRFGYLYAPANGVISEVNAEANENIAPGQSVAVLNAGSVMEIGLGIPENTINRINENDTVTVTFASLLGKNFKGTVTEVSPAIAASTATYPVRIRLNDPTAEIKSGMAANVTFHFEGGKTPTKTLIVPAYAVGEDFDGRFVFLIVEDGETVRIKKQLIQTGKLTADGFEIKSGIEAGQRIATAGLQTLLDGQEIKL